MNTLHLGIKHVFQPIYDISSHVVIGNEVFLRGDGQLKGRSPLELIELAVRGNYLYEFDFLSFQEALRKANAYFRQSTIPRFFFVNLFPSTLVHPDFLRDLEKLLSSLSFPLQNVVIEICEAEQANSIQIYQTLSHLRSLGFRISIDDLGQGFGSLFRLLELDPDFVKLDKYFGQGIAHSPKKQRLVSSILSYCSESIGLVVEGVESQEDLIMLRRLKVPFAQGYYLGSPGQEII